jgi:hypothetical protein
MSLFKQSFVQSMKNPNGLPEFIGRLAGKVAIPLLALALYDLLKIALS